MNRLLAIILFSLVMAGLTAQESTWNLAPELDDGIPVVSPLSQGFIEDSLGNLLRAIGTTPADFRSLIVIKDGNFVVDEYFSGYMEPNIHDIRSAGKSITSMCVGIAIDQGLFNLTDPLAKFFPEKDFSKDGRAATVEDLLTMSAGLATDDYDNDSPGTEGRMMSTDDYIQFILALPMDFTPGSRWAYSSAIAFMAGALVEITSGMTLEDFARKHLFGPLDITELYWQKSPKGRSTGMGNLYMQGRDCAKLGLLMLNRGNWRGQQLISSDYCDRSVTKKLDISEQDPFAHGYGYMWYLAQADVKGEPVDYYFASGNGGNKIYVFPSLDMVVTTMSSAYGTGYGQYRSLRVMERVLSAIK